jgi:Protein of unknown function (DUF4240)
LQRYRGRILELLRDFRSAIAAIPGNDHSDIDREIDDFLRDEQPTPQRPLASRSIVDRAAFWSLIAEARTIATEASSISEILEASFTTFSPSDIERFDEIMSELLDQSYTWDLWAVAYATRHGCGDDEFDYFRAWLVLQGRQVYEAAVADPVAWALEFEFTEDLQCEPFLDVPRRTYRAQTGRELPRVRLPRQQKPRGRKWSEREFAVRYPTLAAHFHVAP